MKKKEKELRESYNASEKSFLKQEKTQIELELEIKKLKKLENQLKKLREI